MAELEAMPVSRYRRLPDLTDDQAAFVKKARAKGLAWATIANRGREVWPQFPRRDWLREHKDQWGAE